MTTFLDEFRFVKFVPFQPRNFEFKHVFNSTFEYVYVYVNVFFILYRVLIKSGCKLTLSRYFRLLCASVLVVF